MAVMFVLEPNQHRDEHPANRREFAAEKIRRVFGGEIAAHGEMPLVFLLAFARHDLDCRKIPPPKRYR